jgi:hypothetical protein
MTLDQALERIADLEAQLAWFESGLAPSDIVHVRKRFGLTDHHARILLELRKVYPRAMRPWALLDRLPNRYGHERDDSMVRVHVHRLRRLLGDGVIATVNDCYRLGEGWAERLIAA